MPTVTLPNWWVLVMPCGCIDGIRRAVIDGKIVTATADEAWAKFTPLKRDRARELREGWKCRAGTDADLQAYAASTSHLPAEHAAALSSPDSGEGDR